MSSSSLRRTPSVQIVLPSPVAGSVRVICPPEPPRTRSHTPRKRKANELSSTTSIEKIAMAASTPSSSTSTPSKRSAPSLPQLDIPRYRPQFASTPDADSRCEGPPSPTSTDIIDVESEDFTRTARRHGVKVRDFAYEPKSALPAKEYWDPLTSLLRHDIHIRRRSLGTYHISGKDLCRLLETGWVQNEEAERNWSAADWEMMKAYRDQPGRPYAYIVGFSRGMPTADVRKKMRMAAFPSRPFDIPDEEIFVPEDEPGMWPGKDMKDCQEGDEEGYESGDDGILKKKQKMIDEEAGESRDILLPLRGAASASNPPHSTTSSATSTSSLSNTSSRTLAPSRRKRSLKRSQTMVRVQ